MSDINSGEVANREFIAGLICTEFGFTPNVAIQELNISAACYRSKDRTIVEVLDSSMTLDLPYDALDRMCRKHRYRMLLFRIISASGAAISNSYSRGYGLKTLDLPVIMSEDALTAYRKYLHNYIGNL
jgi:hypothetical protein